MNSDKSLAFSGYRKNKLPHYCDENTQEIIFLKNDLREVILNAIHQGFTQFYTGMADGFDTLAYNTLLSLKPEFRHIKIIAVLPFDRNNIDIDADEKIVMADDYSKGVYFARNDFMIDNSSMLICYYDGRYGGTEYTFEQAKKKGLHIINLAAENDQAVFLFDNITNIVRDDLERNIRKSAKVSIAADTFSIYAYDELKRRFRDIKSLRFIFTSPTFITEKGKKERREFYIPRLSRERSLYGTEFELRLRNKLTQKSIAKDCAEWIKKKAVFKSNITNENMVGFINVENVDKSFTYSPLKGFTSVDIGCDRGNNIYNYINRMKSPANKQYLEVFDNLWQSKDKLEDVTAEVIESIGAAYKENSAEHIYFITLHNIFNEFLEDLSEDILPNEATGFKNTVIWNKLYSFQKDAALSIISKLEKHNGCILADSVGLGKTFTALAVMKYYEIRNKKVLLLCPKKLGDNWNTFNNHYINNPLEKDKFNYDVFYHTDLSRQSGFSNGKDLSRVSWRNYDLVVIDESHNFRNGGNIDDIEDGNRYSHLLNNIIKPGVKTKVLCLSATPVNNRFNDLKNQLALAYNDEKESFAESLKVERGIDEIFRRAQAAYNAWEKEDAAIRTTENLLKRLDYDFFELLDSVTIARSRKHIEKYYDISEVGRFPERLKPKAVRSTLSLQDSSTTFNDIYNELSLLNLSIYTPSEYILPSKIMKYSSIYDKQNFKQIDREKSLLILMRINLLKRLESSVRSFGLTLGRMIGQIEQTILLIDNHKKDFETQKVFDLDIDDNENEEVIGNKVKIEIGDMDAISWRRDLQEDLDLLKKLHENIATITPALDSKLLDLFAIIKDKLANPINEGNRKILIFSAFADTVDYLYMNITANFKIDTAKVIGTDSNKTTIKNIKTDANTLLTLFSPISKERDITMPDEKREIDILVATDCISEGQNLQDCDYLINYDIHWNPVRIIQRFGRIDRIGSRNKRIQLINFWPDLTLDDYLSLKSRVESRMKIANISATGDDNIIDAGDTEAVYRKNQLEKLQSEVVDLEEITGGVSIMDLGLNEFRMDLISYMKENKEIEKAPNGMHAVSGGLDKGVIFVLKNINADIDIEHRNRMHPFYLVYVSDGGDVISNHLQPKETLDFMRKLCKGNSEPERELYKKFNDRTKDGEDMKEISALLRSAVAAIISVNDESILDDLLRGRTVAPQEIKGINDFELICFLRVE